VLAAIELNGEFHLKTIEVEYVRSNTVLTMKFQAAQTAVTYVIPKPRLGIRLVAPEASAAIK